MVHHDGLRHTAEWTTLRPMTTGEEATRQAIRARLRELVASARPGERLPSERDLAARWNAARMTVRHATDSLVAEGLVARRHGSGTYVLPRPIVRFLGLTSFTQDMRERGLEAGARVLAFEAVAADGPDAAALRIPVGTPVLRFTRLRTGSGDPMAIETVCIPATSVPGLAAADLDGSLYTLLATRYRLAPGSAAVTIEPVVPDAATQALLGIPASQACLRLRMTDSDARGRVLMTADCIYRGDRYQLSAEVSNGAATALPLRARAAG